MVRQPHPDHLAWSRRAEALTRERGYDAALCVVLAVTVFTCLQTWWPARIFVLDEGVFLYEAKRILDGQVMYRDFFDLVGPASNYALALIYLLFGVSMETAPAAWRR